MKMKSGIRILTIALSLLITFSCRNIEKVEEQMHTASGYMEQQPELALELLDSIDCETLSTRKAQARHALLYSMALDKNYIDVTNDSILSPAIKYYKNHGTADDKLLTYYYWGRIAMNAGDYENALKRFISAEQYVNDAHEHVAAARLYKAQMVIYQYSYESSMILEAAQEAASHYLSAKDTTRYINTLNDVVAGHLHRQDTAAARESLNEIKSYWSILTPRQVSNWYSAELFLNEFTGQLNAEEMITEYLAAVPDSSTVRWLSVANAHYYSGEYEKAIDALKEYSKYEKPEAAYYLISGHTNAEIGNYLQAAHSYGQYIELTSEKNGALFESDINFIKERYEAQLRISRNRFILIILALCAMLLFLTSILVMNRIKQVKLELRVIEAEKNAEKIRHDEEMKKTKAEADKYADMYGNALAEIENLNETLQNTALDHTVKMHIVERLNLLNKFIASNMTPYFSKDAANELKQLMNDKKHFIESTRISFLIEHPQFIHYLKKRGLSDSEIGYCCLYAMGLKGKDISSYMGNGHYKLSSMIRKKLSLSEHDTNLDIYLRQILAKIGA